MRVTAAGLPLETSISGKTGAGVWASASYLAACCMLQSPKLHGDVASAAESSSHVCSSRSSGSSSRSNLTRTLPDRASRMYMYVYVCICVCACARVRALRVRKATQLAVQW